MNRRELIGAGAGTLLAAAALPALGKMHMRTTALALQTVCDAVNQDDGREAARERMRASIDRVGGQIASAKGFLKGFNGYDLSLVVLPEYWMTGFPLRESREQWQDKAAIDMEGEFADALSSLAQSLEIYLCSNHYENDPNFPELYFQANVVYGPSGDVALRYRRMISLYTPSPYDVWDAYLDAYGMEAVFPVARTPIGNLASIASEEILYPEIARAHAFAGAELFLHPTSEVAAPTLTPKHIAKKARAVENMAYVISANSARIIGTPVPAASTDGMSIIVDWYGRSLAEASQGETLNANAVIDLGGLRSARSNTGMTNTLSRLPTKAFAAAYGQADHAPPNRAKGGRMIERAEALSGQQAVIDRLTERGVLRKP